MADPSAAALDPTISKENKNEEKNKGNEEKEKEAAAGGDTFLSACFWILFTFSISMIFLDAVMTIMATDKAGSWTAWTRLHNAPNSAPFNCGCVGSVCGLFGAYGVSSSGGGVGKNQPQQLRKFLKVCKAISLALAVVLVLGLLIIAAQLHNDYVMPRLEGTKQVFDDDFKHRVDYWKKYTSAATSQDAQKQYLIPFPMTNAAFLIAELIVAFAFCSVGQGTAVLLIAGYGAPQLIFAAISCCKFICTTGRFDESPPPSSGRRQTNEAEDKL